MTTPSDGDRPRRSIERRGLGQSGYTAGRTEGDYALERDIEVYNSAFPRGVDDEHALERGDDDRWIGRGGLPWGTPAVGDAASARDQNIPERDEDALVTEKPGG